MPTSQLLSEPGPTFRIADDQLPNPQTLIAYGDQRFTDPSNTRSTDPRIRQWLVKQIASETPGAVIMIGDVPLAGSTANDYTVYRTETKVWRDMQLHVFPALGNHEFVGAPQRDLKLVERLPGDAKPPLVLGANRVARLPVGVGQRYLAVAREADQANWIENKSPLPASIDFVIVAMHHPPVADVQTHIEVITIRGPMIRTARLSFAGRKNVARCVYGQCGAHPQLRATCGRWRDLPGLRRWRRAALLRRARCGRSLQEHFVPQLPLRKARSRRTACTQPCTGW